MNDLAARLNWSKSRLSHQLARMQARGLVEREECPSDARGRLRRAGRRPVWPRSSEAAPEHVDSVRRHLIDVLDAEQLAQLAAIAERVVEHLGGESACTAAVADAGTADGLPAPLRASLRRQ